MFELIPLRDALERADALPAGAATTVTASPTHGIESTIELCEGLILRGHPATPHLAAHMIRDRVHLADLLDRCVSAGIRDVFVVGGDAKDRGEIHDGLALLRMMEELGHPFEAVGVAGYPEGHPSIPEEVLLSSLKEKQTHATYLTTQMSFDANAISSWIARIRSAGVTLPVHLGLPGAVDVRRLLRVAARIGVGGSLRYLGKNRQLLRLLFRRSFTPDRLLRSLGPTLADPEADVRAIHLFTFNQVETIGRVAASGCWTSSAERAGPPQALQRSSRRTTGGRRRASFARRADAGSPARRPNRLWAHIPGSHRLGSRSSPQPLARRSSPSVRSKTIRFALTSTTEWCWPASASCSSRSIEPSLPASPDDEPFVRTEPEDVPRVPRRRGVRGSGASNGRLRGSARRDDLCQIDGDELLSRHGGSLPGRRRRAARSPRRSCRRAAARTPSRRGETARARPSRARSAGRASGSRTRT